MSHLQQPEPAGSTADFTTLECSPGPTSTRRLNNVHQIHDTASMLINKTRSRCRCTVLTSTTLFKPLRTSHPPGTVGADFRHSVRDETDRVASPIQKWPGGAQTGRPWLARKASESSAKCNDTTLVARLEISPEWWTGSLRCLEKLVNLAGPGTFDPTLPEAERGKGKMEKTFPCHPLVRGSIGLGLDLSSSLFSARRHPH